MMKIKPEELLESWEDIFNQIEHFRKYSESYNELISKRERNRNFNKIEYNVTDYYNNISILGGRGTGKTSLLIDIRDKINKEKQYKNDLLFDIITPDIRDKEDVLGWIISLVKKKYEELNTEERSINRSERNNGYCEIFNCNENKIKSGALKKLEQAYFFRKPMYENIIVNDYSSKIDYLNDNIEKLNSDVNIKELFSKVIDDIVDLKGRCNNPMLIFLFDDVDIHTSRINEVLLCIMNYLSHPNIVTIIAGDYDSAMENVTLKMLQEDKINDYELMTFDKFSEHDKKSLLDRRKDRSYNMLKKVLPPSYRHYIYPLKNEKKYNFMKKSLEELDLEVEKRTIINNIKEFINYNGYILYDYVCFLDDTIRGYKNVEEFIISRNIEDILNKNDENAKTEKFNCLEELLNVIIRSNLNLEKNSELIHRVINLSKSNQLDSRGIKFNGYINYEAIVINLNYEISKNEAKILSKKQFELYYEIFILANFFEKLIIEFKLREDPNIDSNILKKLHGLKELIQILNLIKNETSIPLVPNLISRTSNLDDKEDIQRLISIKQNLFQVLRYEEIQQLFKDDGKNSGNEYLEAVYLDSLNYKDGIIKYLEETYYRDKKWVSSILNYILDKVLREEAIEENEILRLEGEYGYNIIHNAVSVYYLSDQKEIEIWSIVDLMNKTFKLIEIYKDTSKTIKNYNNMVSKRKQLLDKIKLENKDILSYPDDEINNLDINRKIEKLEEFIYNDVNQLRWNEIKEKIYKMNQIYNNLNNDFKDIKNTLEKDVLNEIINDKNFDKTKYKDLSVKYNFDKETQDFIKDYIENLKSYNELKKHPLNQKIKTIEELKNIEFEIKHFQDDIKRLEQLRKSYVKKMLKNQILDDLFSEVVEMKEYKYYLNSIKFHEKFNDDKVTEKDFDKIFMTIDDILDNEKINYIMQKCIHYVINFYNNEIEQNQNNIENYTSKIINFKNLLDSFKKEIDNLKEVDKKISENLYSDLFNLNQSQINYFESKLNNINYFENEEISKYNLTITDIYTLKNAILDKAKDINEFERVEIRRLLKHKEIQLQDENFKLRRKVFNYAFNLTLCEYLDYIKKEYRDNFNNKVRTKYLLEITNELKNRVENLSRPNAFISYVKEKLK